MPVELDAHARIDPTIDVQKLPGDVIRGGRNEERDDARDVGRLPHPAPGNAARGALVPGDIIIVARGRRYYTNDALITELAEISRPAASISLGATPAASIYVLDAATIAALKQLP